MTSTIRPRVDTKAPLLHVEHVLKTGKLVHDIERQRTLARDNRELLKKINQIYRSKGFLNVDYSYRVHQSLNSESRMDTARQVERANRLLLSRLLRRKPTVDSNLGCVSKKSTPGLESAGNYAQFTIDFWERNDRWLCHLIIASTVKDKYLEKALPIEGKHRKICNIFHDTCLVLQSCTISQDEDAKARDLGNIHHLAKGCLVRQQHGQREHLLLTLRPIVNLPGGKLVGRVDPSSMVNLELLNYYGTKFGRCREPIFYKVKV